MTPKPRTPNQLFAQLRQDLPFPGRPGKNITQHELSEAVNQALTELYPDGDPDVLLVDTRWVSALERGEIRSTSPERVQALMRVFGLTAREQLGLHPLLNTSVRRTGTRPTTASAAQLAALRAPASRRRPGDSVHSRVEDPR